MHRAAAESTRRKLSGSLIFLHSGEWPSVSPQAMHWHDPERHGFPARRSQRTHCQYSGSMFVSRVYPGRTKMTLSIFALSQMLECGHEGAAPHPPHFCLHGPSCASSSQRVHCACGGFDSSRTPMTCTALEVGD